MQAIIKNQYNKKHPKKCSGGIFFIKNETEIKEIFFLIPMIQKKGITVEDGTGQRNANSLTNKNKIYVNNFM